MKSKKTLIYYLLCLYIFITPLIPVDVKPSKLHWLSEVILFIIISLFFAKRIFVNRNKISAKVIIREIVTDKIFMFMIILLLIMLISISYSTERKLALSESARFLSYVFIYFIIKHEIKSSFETKGLITSYLLSCFTVSVFGIIQFFTGIGLQINFMQASYTRIKIASTLDNPNSLAAFTILALFPTIMISIYEKNLKKKLCFSLLSILLLLNSILTFSRNALIGIFVGLCVLALIYNWRIILVVIASIAVAINIPQIAHRIKDIDNYTQNMSRIYLWEIALKMIKDHPILGVGNGNYVSLYDQYVSKYPKYSYGWHRFPVHNSYLKIESELGILGGISFCSIIILILRNIYQFIKSSSEDFYRYFYTGFFASFIAFLVMNLFDNLFFVPKITIYVWSIIAVLQTINRNKMNNVHI